MENQYVISDKVINFVKSCEDKLSVCFKNLEDTAFYNQAKVLTAFKNHRVSEAYFAPTTGYGYDDIGRDALDEIYAEIFETEDALVRHNIISGTHAIATCLFGILRPGDTLLAVTGKPYDTLEQVIGISGSCGKGSLKDFGISYKEVPLLSGKYDIAAIKNALTSDVKAVIIQKSKGYDWRESLTSEEIGKIVSAVKSIKSDVVCIVDNCYGEFVEKHEPTYYGADLAIGSLIKNPGGGLAQTGGYVAGKKELVELVSYRLTCPGIGKECGASLDNNRKMYQGLFMAPHTVLQCLKGAALCAQIFSDLGFDVIPKPTDYRSCIIEAIAFKSPERLINFCQAIQSSSPVDSFVCPEPWDMPGYSDQVIMAAGTFVSGASIELSADAPIKEPYIGYMQGGLTYESVKLSLMNVLQTMINKEIIDF